MRRGRGGGIVQLGAGVKAQEPKFGTLEGSGRPKRPKTTQTASPALLALSEREFQRIVRTALERAGFTVWVFPNMKLTTAGVPDLTFWHPRLPGRIWYWELKRESGRPTSAQVLALAHLASLPGADARIVRPSDWPALRDGLLPTAPAPSEQEGE